MMNMATISGIFDCIACALYFQHSKYEFMDGKAPGIVLFAQTMFIIAPIALFISAYVAYLIFADFRDQMDALEPMLQQQRGAQQGLYYNPDFDRRGGGGGGGGGGRQDRPPPPGGGGGGARGPHGAQPFQGRGQRLGG